jgi:hypothetical protein
VFTAADLPATLSQAAQPNLVNQFGRRKGGGVTFAPQLSDRDVVQGGQYFSQDGFGDLSIAAGKALQLRC